LKIAVRNNSNKLNYEINLLNKIKNLPTPRPLKTKSGNYTFDYKGHRTFIYPFLVGKEESKFTKKMLFEVGEFLGKLHLQTKGFKSSIERTDYYTITPKKLKRVLKESRHLKHPKVAETISYLKENAFKYKLPSGLPSGAMHIDVKPENTLFNKGKLSGVVDFDNAYPGPLVFDLADTLMWFSIKNGMFNLNDAKIIVKGYKRVRILSKQEYESLFNAIHYVILGLALCGLDFLAQKKLPEYFVVWCFENLLEAEKNLKITKKEFQEMFR